MNGATLMLWQDWSSLLAWVPDEVNAASIRPTLPITRCAKQRQTKQYILSTIGEYSNQSYVVYHLERKLLRLPLCAVNWYLTSLGWCGPCCIRESRALGLIGRGKEGSQGSVELILELPDEDDDVSGSHGNHQISLIRMDWKPRGSHHQTLNNE